MTNLGNENLWADADLTKRRAYFIKSRLDELGHKLPLTHAYEILAASCGYRNWPTMKAQLPPDLEAKRTEEPVKSLPEVSFKFESAGGVAERMNLPGGQIDLVYAPPGRGKSSLVHALNVEMIRKAIESGKDIPEIVVIDIGPSARGFASLVQRMLPQGQTHKVAYHKVGVGRSWAMNPFDTHLGFRAPTPHQRAFLVNLVMSMITDSVETEVDRNAIGQVGRLVDALFRYFSDGEGGTAPKTFSKDVSPGLIAALRAHAIAHIEGKTTWWSIVDALTEKGLYGYAELAHRQAMPSFSNLRDLMWSSSFTEANFNPDADALVHAVRFCAGRVAGIPQIGDLTRFDKGKARVVILDLEGVWKSCDRRLRDMEMIYMSVSQTMCRDFFLCATDLVGLKEPYKQHHLGRIRHATSGQQIVLDDVDYLRTSSAREQVMRDAFRAKEMGIGIRIATQLFDCFHPDLVGRFEDHGSGCN